MIVMIKATRVIIFISNLQAAHINKKKRMDSLLACDSKVYSVSDRVDKIKTKASIFFAAVHLMNSFVLYNQERTNGVNRIMPRAFPLSMLLQIKMQLSKEKYGVIARGIKPMLTLIKVPNKLAKAKSMTFFSVLKGYLLLHHIWVK